MKDSMRQLAYPLILLTSTMILTACGGGSDSTPPASASAVASDTQENNPPEIGRILTDIRHIPTVFRGETKIEPPQESIAFAVNVEVTDPDGGDDLEYIYITQVDDDLWWNLIRLSDDANRNECRIGSTDIFYCNFYSSKNLHSIQLSNWKIIAEDKAGNITEKTFQFAGFNGVTASENNFIYSPKYSGNFANGLPTLESLSYEDNGLIGRVNEAAESFQITFEATDTRIKNYSVELFAYVDRSFEQRSGVWVSAGNAIINNNSITSSPIVAGTLTRVDLSWADISYRDGFGPTDISAAHVWVNDEFIEVEPGVFWAHQVGISEFLSLY